MFLPLKENAKTVPVLSNAKVVHLQVQVSLCNVRYIVLAGLIKGLNTHRNLQTESILLHISQGGWCILCNTLVFTQ